MVEFFFYVYCGCCLGGGVYWLGVESYIGLLFCTILKILVRRLIFLGAIKVDVLFALFLVTMLLKLYGCVFLTL